MTPEEILEEMKWWAETQAEYGIAVSCVLGRLIAHMEKKFAEQQKPATLAEMQEFVQEFGVACMRPLMDPLRPPDPGKSPKQKT